jgi:predicted DNA-binding ribbon-helix-helix protein
MLKSSIIEKRSVKLVDLKTSISLEGPFWDLLNEIAQKQGKRVSEIVMEIDKDRKHANLSSGVRLFILDYVRDEIKRQNKMAKAHAHKKDGRG